MSRPFPSHRHQAALYAPTGYRRWIRVTASRGGVSETVEPTGGRLTQDARRTGRWDGSLTLAGEALVPRGPSDLLSPFGTLVNVTLGVELLDGSVSSVAYGTYEISGARTRVEAGEYVVDIGLTDVSGRVDRYRMENPLTIPAGTDVSDLVNAVVADRTGVDPGVAAAGSTLGVARVLGLDTNAPPWKETVGILDGFSLTAWYDRDGEIQVGSVDPDPATAYPLDYLTDIGAEFSSWPANVVVTRGEASDGTEPVQAIAMDDDPSSPTYAGTGPGTSPYGRVTEYYSSPLIRTAGQALSAAQTILTRRIGQGSAYEITCPYDPTVDAGDVVSLAGKPLAVDSVTVNLAGRTTLHVRGL